MPELEVPSLPIESENPTPAENAPSTASDFDSLPDWAKEQIKSLRKENGDRRSKLTAFEKAEETRKQATLSDIEKAQNAEKTASERAAALEMKLVQRDAMSALSAANLIDSDLAYLAIKDKISVEDGEATNLDDLVAQLIKNKPHLVKVAEPTKPLVPDTKSTSPSNTPTQNAPKRAPGRF